MSTGEKVAGVFIAAFTIIIIVTCLYGLGTDVWENKAQIWIWMKDNPKATIVFGSMFGFLISIAAMVTVLDKATDGMKILHAILAEPNKLIHERSHDTHETIDLPVGEYEFRIAREFDHYAELARQSAD